MDETPTAGPVYSRRQFLAGASLAVTGGLALTVALGRPLLSRFTRRSRPPDFPKGSIFTPAKDRRTKM